MHKQPSPIMQILIRDIAEVKKHIQAIKEKLSDPQLYDKLQEEKTEKK